MSPRTRTFGSGTAAQRLSSSSCSVFNAQFAHSRREVLRVGVETPFTPVGRSYGRFHSEKGPRSVRLQVIRPRPFTPGGRSYGCLLGGGCSHNGRLQEIR